MIWAGSPGVLSPALFAARMRTLIVVPGGRLARVASLSVAWSISIQFVHRLRRFAQIKGGRQGEASLPSRARNGGAAGGVALADAEGLWNQSAESVDPSDCDRLLRAACMANDGLAEGI